MFKGVHFDQFGDPALRRLVPCLTISACAIWKK